MSDTNVQTTYQVKVPSMWKVVIHNDDFTPVEFVVALVHNIFGKTRSEAVKIAYIVHNTGKANVGMYSKEVAQTKVMHAILTAEKFKHPLLTTAEEA